MKTKKTTAKYRQSGKQQRALPGARPGRRNDDEDKSRDHGPDLVEMVSTLMQAAGMGPEQAATFLVETASYFAQHSTETSTAYDDWKRTAVELLERSIWPWPTRESGPIAGYDDGRTWADEDDWLRERGSSLEALIKEQRLSMKAVLP
jgi:hypothetical protein